MTRNDLDDFRDGIKSVSSRQAVLVYVEVQLRFSKGNGIYLRPVTLWIRNVNM